MDGQREITQALIFIVVAKLTLGGALVVLLVWLCVSPLWSRWFRGP
jgi:hypothetical protein